jgi:class 3 adenylate cyclase/pimeloyl-ACP methyl ester carboxylesterase
MPNLLPQTRYATNKGHSIAYQVLGQESPDVVLVHAFVSNVEMQWEIPPMRRFLERLASFSRLIVLDKRGTGLSDRVPVDRLPPFVDRVSDVLAVMDAAGSSSATLFGISEGGAMSVLLAAGHPERVDGLVLFGSYAKKERAATDQDQLDALVSRIQEQWGTGSVFLERSESLAGDPNMARLLGLYERHSASPRAAAAIVRMGSTIDVTEHLSSVRMPTLVLHRTDDPSVSPSGSEALAAGIPHARLVRLPGADHLPFFGDTEQLLGEIEEFVTGIRSTPEPDRLLLTLLFVDIVGSTDMVRELGDRRWGDRLGSFFQSTRSCLARHDGTEIDTAGDGFLATFPSPTRAVRCACEIRDTVLPLGLTIRAGLHAGEVQRRGDDLSGMSVHIGARIVAAAADGEVWISRTVRDLVHGSNLPLEDRGMHELKGTGEPWRLYAVMA